MLTYIIYVTLLCHYKYIPTHDILFSYRRKTF